VNPAQQGGRSVKPYVFVLDKNSNPLMPCSFSKSKKLCKRGAAKVVKCYPFVIQLLVDLGSNTQPVTMGIDTGATHVGVSVVSEKKEFVSQEVKLDKNTHKRLIEKKMYRVGRRSIHHWYRKPRFSNRKRKDGWLPPSIDRSYQTHINLISFWKRYLPKGRLMQDVREGERKQACVSLSSRLLPFRFFALRNMSFYRFP
jgi:hypothetical protein